jgi:hypothetical protein
MYESLKTLSSALAEAKKQAQERGKLAAKEAFAELFAAHPSIVGIRWRQYTPYFNDGEPCVFRSNIKYFEIKIADQAGDEDDGYSEPAYSERANGAEGSPIRAVYELVKHLDDEMLLLMFGDHVRVTATLGGFDVEEYEHD